MVSGLLMSAPYWPEGLHLQVDGKAVSQPFVHMTLRLMQQCGVQCSQAAGSYHVPGAQLYCLGTDARGLGTYTAPPDATQASYWAAYAYVSRHDVLLAQTHADALQGDWAFLHLLQQHGLLQVAATAQGMRLSPGNAHQGFEADLGEISDTFITLAFLAPLLSGPTVLHGLGHTQHQESPRLSAVAQLLTDLGQHVCIQDQHTLRITPRLSALRERACALHPAPLTLPSYGDHRIAMALGILGCYDLKGHQKPWLAIRDPLCCNKTYPHYWHALQCLS
jgi:3-phosphoshikimate 1-carboxyvinyltransferase